MWKQFVDRLSEPSTWAGLAAATFGIGQIADINEAPAVAETLSGVGSAMASGADPMTAGIMAVAGLASIFMKEKGGK